MTRLRDRHSDLAAIISRAADASGIPPAFVEKDFWVVELLRSVSQPIDGAFVVFKGGTSLSKAYGLVQRFSEDVDILLAFAGQPSIAQRDGVLKEVCARVERDVGIPAGEPFSKRGVLRIVRYGYESDHADGRITEGVLLEVGIRGNPDPREEHELRSYVAQHATTVMGLDAGEYEEFAPVRVQVLRPERTLVEKLSIAHHLGTLDAESIRTSEKGRHLYDIHQLLGDDATVAAITGTEYVATAARDAEEHSAANDWEYSPRPDDGFGASPTFDPAGSNAEAMEAAYERVRPLVYGRFPSFAEVIERVRAHAASL